MTAPLTMSFDVACSADHAFWVWTSRIGLWWPADHTVTGRDDLHVVMQGGVGGRIYERTPDGAEHDWGEITAWDPRPGWPTCGTSTGTAQTRPRWRSGSSPAGPRRLPTGE